MDQFSSKKDQTDAAKGLEVIIKNTADRLKIETVVTSKEELETIYRELRKALLEAIRLEPDDLTNYYISALPTMKLLLQAYTNLPDYNDDVLNQLASDISQMEDSVKDKA